jgi:glycosyltransferase involved in cell wall biosynthesis
MPARDAAATIGAALRSVLLQSGPDLEVIVVDDGSSDGTGLVADGMVDPRVRVLRNPRPTGIGAAHNLATRMARGRYVVHVDADDIVLPGGIEGAVAPLRRRSELAQTYSDFFDLDAGAGIDPVAYRTQLRRFDRRHGPGVDVRRELLVHGMVANHLRAYRKDALVAVGGFDESVVHGEDWAMALALAHRYRIAPTGAWLYARRVRPDSTSGGPEMTPLRFWWDHLPLLRRLLEQGGGTLCGYNAGEVAALTLLRAAHAAGLVAFVKRWKRAVWP